MMKYLFEKVFGDKYERHMKKPRRFYTKPISEECWNLDMSFIEFIIPRLELFKKEASKIIVYDFTIIDKILDGFRLYLTKSDWELDEVEQNYKKFQTSMRLFAKNVQDFWW